MKKSVSIFRKNKSAAMEMSMGTLVIIVLSVTLLILGMVFIRSLMCSGIQIGEEVSAGVKNELKTLFGANDYGVKCIGEGSSEVKLGTGGTRKLICIVKLDSPAKYEISATKVESLKGAQTAVVQNWILSNKRTVDVIAGSDREVDYLILDIPRDAQATKLDITIQAKNLDLNTQETITATIDIVPSGAIRGAIC